MGRRGHADAKIRGQIFRQQGGEGIPVTLSLADKPRALIAHGRLKEIAHLPGIAELFIPQGMQPLADCERGRRCLRRANEAALRGHAVENLRQFRRGVIGEFQVIRKP